MGLCRLCGAARKPPSGSAGEAALQFLSHATRLGNEKLSSVQSPYLPPPSPLPPPGACALPLQAPGFVPHIRDGE